MHIMILGCGGFGIAMAILAQQRCMAQLTMWTPFAQECKQLRDARRNERLLPGALLPPEVAVTTSLANAELADMVLLAVPSDAVRDTLKRLQGQVKPTTPIVCLSKGLEMQTLSPLSQVIAAELPENPFVMLSGPSHAEELARGVPTSMVAASHNRDAAMHVQNALMHETLRIYIHDDVRGVELGGALKNVIALAAGILDGTGMGGDNAKAALITRGITEIARLGVAMGGRPETFGGLSGIGDLIVTCQSAHSRNRQFGILMGQGNTVQQAEQLVGKTVEGYHCTLAAYRLAWEMDVEMPIVNATHNVLYQGGDVRQCIRQLMTRPGRAEMEQVWL